MLSSSGLVDAEKALEREPSDAHSRQSRRRNKRRRTGNNVDRNAVFVAEPDQVLARVGNSRHSGVRYKRTGFARKNSFKDNLALFTAVMLKVAYHRLFDSEVIEKL